MFFPLIFSSTIIQKLSTSFTICVCEKASHNIYPSYEVQNFDFFHRTVWQTCGDWVCLYVALLIITPYMCTNCRPQRGIFSAGLVNRLLFWCRKYGNYVIHFLISKNYFVTKDIIPLNICRVFRLFKQLFWVHWTILRSLQIGK